jgi:outer membrane protein assembly factor BamB
VKNVLGATAQPYAFGITSGEIIVISGSGVAAYSAQKGSSRWRVTSDRVISTVTISGSVIVLRRAGGDDWVGIDAATGKVLWKRPHVGSMLTFRSLKAPDTDGVVPAVVDEYSGANPGVIGIDAHSGKTRWRLDSKSVGGCVPDTGALTQGVDIGRRLLVFDARCGRQAEIVAFDMVTGKPAWHRAVPSPISEANGTIGPGSIAAVGGDGVVALKYTGSGDASGSVIFGPDGRQLAIAPNMLPASMPGYNAMTVAGQTALVEANDSQADIGFGVVDLHAGKAGWTSAAATGLVSDPGTRSPFAFDGSTLYALNQSDAVVMTDVATKRRVTAQFPSGFSVPPGSWIGVAGGYLLLAEPAPGGIALSAFRRG